MDIRELSKLSNWSHVHTLVCVGSDVAKNLVHYSRRASSNFGGDAEREGIFRYQAILSGELLRRASAEIKCSSYQRRQKRNMTMRENIGVAQMWSCERSHEFQCRWKLWSNEGEIVAPQP